MEKELEYPINEKDLNTNLSGFIFARDDLINDYEKKWFRKIKIWNTEYIEVLVQEWKDNKFQFLYKQKEKKLISVFNDVEWGYLSLKIIWGLVLVIWKDLIFYCMVYSTKNLNDTLDGEVFEGKSMDILTNRVLTKLA